MIAGGVPSGAKHAYQDSIATPLKPASCNVGRSGMLAERASPDWASNLILPPAACGKVAVGPRQPTFTCPAIRSLIACPAPRYGTWSRRMSAALLNHSISTCWFDPTPDVAQPVPGAFFTAATSSAIE